MLGKGVMSGRIHASLDPEEHALAGAGVDRVVAEAQRAELSSARHAVPSPQETRQIPLEVRGLST